MQGASRLCGLKTCKHGCRAAKVDEATTVGGDRLIVARAGAEEVAEFIVAATEALRRDEALEAPHTSYASFDAPMILLEPIVFVRAGPMHNPPAECRADRPRVGAVPVRGDALGGDASGGFGRAEEGLRRGHVAVLAQHGVDEIAVAVDRPVQIGPAAADFQVGLVHVPVPAAAAALAVPALAKLVGQQRRELRLPLPNGLVADNDPGRGTSRSDRAG